jgi:hypothetical protein
VGWVLHIMGRLETMFGQRCQQELLGTIASAALERRPSFSLAQLEWKPSSAVSARDA